MSILREITSQLETAMRAHHWERADTLRNVYVACTTQIDHAEPGTPEDDSCIEALRRLRSEAALAVASARAGISEDATAPNDLETIHALLARFSDDATIPLAEGPDSAPTATLELPGYCVLRRIGAGGMGIVWEAEQRNPRRRVAVKVIRGRGYVTEQQVRLFQREAQALARLRHPGIASIHDAGRTADGHPFFVMELVNGVTLTDYARDLPLHGSHARGHLRARLDLFLQIADAIAYAHHRGVIHRDLKPSNILVGSRPGSGPLDGVEVKVLDFGLARITDPDVNVSLSATEPGRILGTVPYMSPEQARGIPERIDVRTDIFSLGVILSELLTDELPIDVRSVPIHEAIRRICEDEPARAGATNRLARGDLETIARKAMEKDTTRRYQSVSALAEDLRRYGMDQPVLARPPSTAYQLKKLAARHRLPVAFAVATFLLSVGFGVAMTILYAQSQDNLERALQAETDARREARTAARVSEFMTGIFHLPDPNESLGNSITVREVLDGGAKRIDDELADEPVVQARMARSIGTSYVGLGLYGEGKPLLERSVSALREALGENDPEVAKGLVNLAAAQRELGELDSARASLGRALESFESLGELDAPFAATVHYGLFDVEERAGDFEKALAHAERCLAIRRATLSADDPETGSARGAVATALFRLGDYEAARTHSEEAIRIAERTLDPVHPHVANLWNNYGGILRAMGDRDGLRAAFEKVLSIRERVLANDHPDLAMATVNLAIVHAEAGSLDVALRYFEAAVPIFERAFGEDHPNVGMLLGNVANLHLDRHEPDRARPLLERALRIVESRLGAKHRTTANILRAFGKLHQLRGDFELARSYYTRANDVRRASMGDEHFEVAGGLHDLGKLERDAGDAAAARDHLQNAIAMYETTVGPTHGFRLAAMRDLARVLRQLGQERDGANIEAEADSLAGAAASPDGPR